MSTNYYIRRKEPTLHETIHVCNRSWGWRVSWQETKAQDYPRWCDRAPGSERNLLRSIRCVDDIIAYLESGQWELVDEYGRAYEDWRDEIQGLIEYNGGEHWDDRNFRPRDHVSEYGEGYYDEHGNVFLHDAFL